MGISIQCGTSTNNQGSEVKDTSTVNLAPAVSDTSLYVTLETKDQYKLSDSILIDFVVHNPTKDTLKFTQYHTPFEGVISKFVDVIGADSVEVDYIGAMARRIMPPPADTYHAVAPNESKRISFDLKKGYKIDKVGTYSIQYNSERISGITPSKAVEITVVD